jgi:hypothetical protein
MQFKQEFNPCLNWGFGKQVRAKSPCCSRAGHSIPNNCGDDFLTMFQGSRFFPGNFAVSSSFRKPAQATSWRRLGPRCHWRYRGALDKSAEMRTYHALKTLKRRAGLTNSR